MKLKLSVFLTGLLLAACGGNGSAPSTFTPPGGTGLAQPVTTIGSISAFGSVFVNGVRYDISGATLTKNGVAATQTQLAVGQIAVVKGKADSNGANGHADSVDVEGNVIGKISSIDATNSKFVVLGQTVIVNGTTSFSSNITPAAIGSLAKDDYVEVSGNAGANGDITATRVEKETGTSLQVVGNVAGIDTNTKTFKINALNVDYKTATVEGFTAGQPANNDLVVVRGTVFDATTTTLTATKVRPASRDARQVAGRDALELEGLITRFGGATDFDVANKKVSTGPTTVFRNGTAADLAKDVKVEVRGKLYTAGTTLVADVVEIERNGVVELRAPATAVDKTGAGKVTVLGVEVTLNAMTRLEDKSATHMQMFSINDLNANDSVVVRGFESPAGSGKLIATRLERIPALGTDVAIRGPFTATTAPQFKILGVIVDTTGATFTAGEERVLTSADFFTGAVGKFVAVRGTLSGSMIAAKQVRIDNREDD